MINREEQERASLEAWQLYTIEQGLKRGRTEGRAEGRAEGLAEGISTTIKQLALSMSPNQIAQALNKPLSEIETILNT